MIPENDRTNTEALVKSNCSNLASSEIADRTTWITRGLPTGTTTGQLFAAIAKLKAQLAFSFLTAHYASRETVPVQSQLSLHDKLDN